MSNATPAGTAAPSTAGPSAAPLSPAAPGTSSPSTTVPDSVPAAGGTGGGGDEHAHYVRRLSMLRSRVTGAPVTALCGKTWRPRRSPRGLPVCPVCRELVAVVRDLGR